jgi:uncharacterized protein (TIGR00369 family)
MEITMPPDAGEPGFGVVPLDKARTLDGLDVFKEVLAGRIPAPPITRALGFRLSEIERGRAVFTYQPVFDHYNPLGTVHGGVAATLLDSAMGCAVHATLKAGQGFTTLEIKVNYVRAMTDKTSLVRAEGKVISAGSRIATAEGRLIDAEGKLLAHATTTCLILTI